MKAKWLNLTWPQRVMLLLQVFLAVLFLILYATLGRQQIIKYDNALFRCRTQGEITTYSGKLEGQKAVFTVSPGPVVEFRVGDTLYGPYTIAEDPTAVPHGDDFTDYHGVEVRQGSQVLFRGAYRGEQNSFFYVLNEDGSPAFSGVKVYFGHNFEPDADEILRIALHPDLIPRGNWYFWWLGLFCCAACAVSILFADNLFRWNLRFQIRDPENAEPSEWALFSRWLSWIVVTIAALVWMIIGLNAPFP